MDTVKFLKEYGRMCKSYGNTCVGCRIREMKDNVYKICQEDISEGPEEAIISIVEKWSSEHPVNTRQSKFLEVFPNARLINGHINICPKYADTTLGSQINCNRKCPDCKKEYWLSKEDKPKNEQTGTAQA